VVVDLDFERLDLLVERLQLLGELLELLPTHRPCCGHLLDLDLGALPVVLAPPTVV